MSIIPAILPACKRDPNCTTTFDRVWLKSRRRPILRVSDVTFGPLTASKR